MAFTVIATIAILALTCLKEIQSVCDPAKLEKIKEGWNGNVPEDLQWLDSSWTTYRTTDQNMEVKPRCWQEEVDTESFRGTEYEFFDLRTETTPFKFSRVKKGVYKQEVIHNRETVEMTVYVVYLNKDASVQAFLMCSEYQYEETFINIKNYKEVKALPKTDVAIEEALAAFQKVDLPEPQEFPTNCP